MNDTEQTEQLTPVAYERLKAELKERSTVVRQEITDRIEEARAHGDLKENAEYHAAKDEQGLNEDRIRNLEARIRTAEVTELDLSSGVVSVGMVVEVEDDGETDEFFIGSLEDTPEDGLEVVSASSPMGRCLIGAKKGDTVRYTGPTGAEFELKIVDVRAP